VKLKPLAKMVSHSMAQQKQPPLKSVKAVNKLAI
jgi:hypothetical protein